MRALLLASAALAGCSASAPTTPTWATDVAPILRANCVRCHADPQLDGAPERIRLDVADETEADGKPSHFGARMVSTFVAARVADRSMPPRWPLTDYQIEVLENWAAVADPGDGQGPARGEPAEDNHAPTLSIDDGTPADDGTVAFAYVLHDVDDDLVTGRIGWRGEGEDGVITNALHSGRGTFVWDQAALPDGDYELVARLDDGSGEVVIEKGGFALAAGADGHAPTIELGENGGMPPLVTEGVPTGEDPAAIAATLGDADLDDLRATLTITNGDEEIVILDDVDAPPGEQAIPFPFDDVPEGDGWRVVLEVTDGTFTRTAVSRDFAVGKATTELRFADVAPILEANCKGCHAGAASAYPIPGLGFDISGGRYDGVAMQYASMYRRAIQQRSMPPTSAGILLDQDEMADADRATLGEWLRAGAPE
jgi:hypothetical protein